jgi:parallel beta-helix repeat protein
MKLPFLFSVGLAALAALVIAAQPSAVPSTSLATISVSCGRTLTASTKLTNDLVNCPGTGLIIGADSITVDLNGHTIDGTNEKSGIDNEGHANVKIVNGTIQDFRAEGVNVSEAPGNVLRKLTVRMIGAGARKGDISAGIFLFKSPRTTITDNVISNQVRAFQVNGIDVYNSAGARVERNRITRNPGEGISLFASPKSRVVGNRLDRNREGMDANSSSDFLRVEGNHASGNRDAGIAVGALRGAQVLGNAVSENGDDGLFLFDLRDSVARGNQASGNFTGIHLYGGQGGVAQYGGKHGSRNNRLLGNRAINNAHTGIWVKGDNRKEAVDRNVLSGNVASRNGPAGGIVVEGSAGGNRLRRNTANANAGHGIVTARGTIDAGGNRAHRNRRSPQCVGVRCS